MELSVLVARILALTYIAAGISALRGGINFPDMIKEFEKSSALTYVTGFFTLLVGMLLVSYHNIWVKDWTVLVTVVGWIAVVKGFVLIAFPQVISSFKGWYKNTQTWGIVMLVLGAIFGYLGFMM